MRSIGSLLVILLLCAIMGYILLALLFPPQPSQNDLYVSGGGPGGQHSAKILDVPFFHQKPWYCSEASASMVLAYYGYNISQDDIHENGYESFETMFPLLSRYVDCNYDSLDIEGLKKEIDEGDPVMIRISSGKDRHTIVVVGYDENFFYVHDPAFVNGENLRTDPEVLLNYWKPTGFAAIVFSR